MDPNATLTELRQAMEQAPMNARETSWQAVADRLAELFDALDEWLSRGGFLPNDWQTDDHGHF